MPSKKQVLVGIFGPKEDINEVVLMIGLTNDNSASAMLMFAGCASTVVPEWSDAGKWVLESIVSLAQDGSGEVEKTVSKKTISVMITKPNILTMNILRDH